MKIKFLILSLLSVLLLSNPLFAEVSEEAFNELLKRVNEMEDVFGKLDNYYLKVDSIESDFKQLSSEKGSDFIREAQPKPGDGVNVDDMNERLRMVEGAVKVLEDRSSLFDFSDEFRRNQEYICENDHVFPITGDNNRCPVCGTKQRSNTLEKVFKYARRENISGRIAAAFDEEFEKRVSVGVSATGIVQQIVASDEEEENFAQGSFDLTFITKLMPSAVFFIDLEAIGGDGPDEIIGSFSGLNADSGTFQDDDGVDRISVREVWVESILFDDKLDIVAGKIDLGNYFDANEVANDETSQFITDIFVNSSTLEPPDQGPGVVTFFNTQKGLRFGVGLQSADNSGSKVTDEIYAIAEVDYTTSIFLGHEGTYRLWARTSGGSDDNKGFGVSLDQNISNRLTAFGRYGANEHNEGDTEVASAWSLGLRLRSPFFARGNDEIGVAFGMIDIVNGNEESSTETYYKYKINEHLSVSSHWQMVFDPAGVGSEDTVIVAGIRTQIDF